MANKTILDKLNELQDAKEDIQAAIREKGGVVSDDTLAGLADDIRDIPQDGYAWESIGWSKAPDDWQQMVNDARAYKDAWEASDPKPDIRTYFNGNTSIRMIPFLEEFNTSLNMSNVFQYCTNLRYIPDELTIENATNVSGCLQQSGIVAANGIKINPNCTNINNLFWGCSSLISIPYLSTQQVQNFSGFLNGCNSLEKITELDWSSATNINNWCDNSSQKFRYCLIKNMGKSTLTTYRFNWNCFATWGINSEKYPDARQSMIDTLITYSYDRATNNMATATIQLHANAKARLTSEEIAAITAKGFTLA